MTSPITKFNQAAEAELSHRGTLQARKSVAEHDNAAARTMQHIDILFSKLKQLPAAAEGVAFRGGVAGGAASLVYSDEYNRRQGHARQLKIETTAAQNGETALSLTHRNKGVTVGSYHDIKDGVTVLGEVAEFLGTVAPERAAEITPLLEQTYKAMRAEAQIVSGFQGRWTARPL